MTSVLLTDLKKSEGREFFKNLELFLECKIPTLVKNVLRVNCYDNALALAGFDETSILEMTEFMAKHFKQIHIGNNETSADYLGIYEKTPEEFQFSSGHIRLLRGLIRDCKVFNISNRNHKDALESIDQFHVTPQKPNEGTLF